MLANQKIYLNITQGLPDDQWAREIDHWFATQLIAIQSYTTEFVTGWQDKWMNQFVTPPNQSNMWMCNSQIIQRKDYASFSVLGIGIILAVGCCFVLLNMCITWIVNRARPRTPIQQYKKGSWKANDLLELHGVAADGIHRRASRYMRDSIDTTKSPGEPEKEPASVTQ